MDDYCKLCGTIASGGLCHSCEVQTAWAMVPAAVREEINDLICRDRWLFAIVAFRDKSGIDPTPSLPLGKCLMGYREGVLREQGRITPPTETTVDDILAKAASLGEPPIVVEASWDGDSRGWMICLYVIVRRPSRHHESFDEVCLAVFRGGDPAEEAVPKGQSVAERLGIPFFFPDPGKQDLDPPRWWDTPGAAHLTIT